MSIDGKEYIIKEYLKQIDENIKIIKDINNNSKDLFNDSYYDFCGICKYKSNKHFCLTCYKNICIDCYTMCQKKNHKILILDKIKDKIFTKFIC